MDSSETNIERVRVGGRNLEESTVGLSGNLFRAKEPGRVLPWMLVTSLVLGLLFGLDPADPGRSLSTPGLLEGPLALGVVFLLIPAVAAALVVPAVVKGQGAGMVPRRSFTLAFISLGFSALVVLTGKALGAFLAVDLVLVMVFSLAALAFLWHAVLVSIVLGSRLRSLPGAIVQTGAGTIALLALGGAGLVDLRHYHFPLMVAFPALLLATSSAWFQAGEAQFRKNIGHSGLGMLPHALSEFTEAGSGRKGLEPFYHDLGADGDVPLGGVLFVPEKPGVKGKAKLFMGSCDAHPGPFGKAGGGELPGRVALALRRKVGHTMLFHGASTHDENPATLSEVDRIAGGFRDLVKDLERKAEANEGGPGGPFVRRRSPTGVCLQPLGGGMLIVHTSAPDPTDDVEPPVGEIVRRKVRDEGWDSAVFVDAHNCLEKGAGGVYTGSDRARALVRSAAAGAKELKRNMEAGSPARTVMVGFSSRGGFDHRRDSIGPQGIQVAAIGAGGKKTAYVLIDGNNMVAGLREKLRSSALDAGFDEAEMFTSDTHVVNARIGGYNPVGGDPGAVDLEGMVGKLCRRALEDMEPCRAVAGESGVRGVRLFGKGLTVRLSLAIHGSLSAMGRTFVPSVALGTAACAALAWML